MVSKGWAAPGQRWKGMGCHRQKAVISPSKSRGFHKGCLQVDGGYKQNMFLGDFYGILSSKIGIGWWIWAHTSAGGKASTTQRNTHSCQDWCILSKVWAVPIYFFPHFNFAKKLLPIINPGCQDVSKQPPSLKNDRRLSCSNHTGFDNRAKETWILKLLPAAWAALSD